jgi:HK97 family phage major capsid protein
VIGTTPAFSFKDIAMDKLLKLQQARAAALARAEAMVDASGKFVAGCDKKGWDTAMAEVATLDGEIKTEQERLDAEANEADASAKRAEAMAAARTGPGSRTRANTEGTGRPIVTHQRERVEADSKRGFKSAGEFGMAVMSAMRPGAAMHFDERLAPLNAISGMGQTVGADGGFLVPPEFSTEIWDGLNNGVDNLLDRCDKYTVEGESLTFVANAETSRATGSRYGGIRAYWLAEGSQMTGSNPKFRELKLEPHQLGVFVPVTDKLLRNSQIALGQYLLRAATDEINFLVSDSIINGTGVGKPKGILSSAARVTVSKENAQAADTIVAANINKMWSRCHARARKNAVWFINQDIEPQLELLSMAVGTGGLPIYLPPGGIADAPNARLKGRPVIPIEFCSTLGDEGDIILADLGVYAAGIRGGIESAMSMHLRFDYNESVFRFLFEADGQPWTAAPITPFKGSNTLAPFVTLEAR